MPNSQSSGAHANHTVNQQSEQGVNNSFDALIDLLASDDIHDIAVADSHPSHSGSPHHTIQLRDASGKLSFEKIRLMFAGQNLGSDRIDKISPDVRLDMRVQCGSGIQDRDVLSRNGLSRSVSSSSQSSERVRQGSCLASDASPAPLVRNIQSTVELVHTKSDEQIFSFQDEPNAQITTVNPVPGDKMLLTRQESSLEKAATRPTEIKETIPLHAGRVQDLTKPLEFEQLNVALSHVTFEINSLRERCDKLRTLVNERLPPSNGLQTGKPSVLPPGNHATASSQVQICDTRGLEFGHLEEISSLSEYEAKNILTGLVTALRLSPHSVTNLVSKFADGKGPLCPHPRSVDDIRSSMDFLARIDELVWKRSVPANGNGPELLYSRANTDALIDRLALWEKVIRSA
ncbi:hypothetical protein BDR04DRAFT_713917 [Suillus decipiens]|nr:hypothetical protein BDR04DRAFT_713917 [Suillus decipiens]